MLEEQRRVVKKPAADHLNKIGTHSRVFPRRRCFVLAEDSIAGEYSELMAEQPLGYSVKSINPVIHRMFPQFSMKEEPTLKDS